MSAVKAEKDHAAEASRDESRREALKSFGRYAAAAPTVMMLLRPRSADAHHRPWHGPPNPGGASGGHRRDKGDRGGGYEG